ncbi:MFS transporter [Zhengella mangrovi]|nr:MFS transporter [Zhengella mangrovi]
MSASDHRPPRSRALPAGIWALGFVSLLMDVSSEMIHALLPVFMVSVLGTSTLAVGMIEGVAEATASITKVFSGAISDWFARRKPLAVLGYGLAALTKPVFPLAMTLDWLVAARFIDRVGKGIRGAPRDALVADIAPPDMRGAAYGLRQSLDTVGAFLGPLLAMVLMWWTADNFRAVFWVAVIPALLAVTVLIIAVREPARSAPPRPSRWPFRRDEMRSLGSTYWWLVAIALVFSLARFSEAFLILRAQAAGLAIALVPVVMVVMNIAYALSAYPAGILSDRAGRFALLGWGLVLLIVADLVLALSRDLVGVGIGVTLWGLHMGLTQGILSAFVADVAPRELRGTAFGVFNLGLGLAALVASLVAGGLWDVAGPEATFLAGAGFAAIAMAGLAVLRRRLRSTATPR